MPNVNIIMNAENVIDHTGEVYPIQRYVIKFVSDLGQVGVFSPGPLVSSTNKTDWIITDSIITEILLKVALNTITPSLVIDIDFHGLVDIYHWLLLMLCFSFQAIMSGNSLRIRLVLYISSHLCFIFKERILTDKSYN